MLKHNKFVQFAKIAICASMIVSLSGCYLSIGGSGKKRKNDGDNIVVTTGGSSAPPVIINNTQPNQPSSHTPSQQNGERVLQPQ